MKTPGPKSGAFKMGPGKDFKGYQEGGNLAKNAVSIRPARKADAHHLLTMSLKYCAETGRCLTRGTGLLEEYERVVHGGRTDYSTPQLARRLLQHAHDGHQKTLSMLERHAARLGEKLGTGGGNGADFIIVAGEKRIGFCGVGVSGGNAELAPLYVLEGHRRSGAARQALKDVLDFARSEGAKTATSMVHSSAGEKLMRATGGKITRQWWPFGQKMATVDLNGNPRPKRGTGQLRPIR